MQGLYPGCVSPVKTTLVVETDDAAFDLSTATAGRILARFADGQSATWEADLSDESATAITLTREHEAADVPAGTEGVVYLSAEVDIPAGTVRTNRMAATVLKL